MHQRLKVHHQRVSKRQKTSQSEPQVVQKVMYCTEKRPQCGAEAMCTMQLCKWIQVKWVSPKRDRRVQCVRCCASKRVQVKWVSPSISTSFSLRLGVDFTAAEKRIPTRPKHPLLSIFTLLFILYTYSDTAYTACALNLKVCNSVSQVYFHTFDCWWLIPVHYTKAIQYVKKRMRVPSMMAIMLSRCHHAPSPCAINEWCPTLSF